MKKVLKITCLVSGVIILTGIIGVSYYTGLEVFNSSMQLSNNEDTGIEKMEEYLKKEGFDIEGFRRKYNIEPVKIKSSTGKHIIPADYISVDGGEDRDTVIMVHGLGGNRITVYPTAEVFLKNGYNVLAYDQRSSGENTAQYTTFGYLESRDLADCVGYLKNNLSDNKKIGLWGISYGGATVGIFLGSEKAEQNVDFAILDSAVSDMTFMLFTEMETMDIGIPVEFLMFTGNMVTRMKMGFFYKDADVCIYTGKTSVPVMVIHSKADTLTPYFMGEDIFNSVPHNRKTIFTVEDSKHADIFSDHPAEYESNIMEFIKKHTL